MATYSKLGATAEKHGVRAIKTATGYERIAQLWLKTSAGLVKIYEGIRSCFGTGRWRGRKPWVGKERWKGI